MKVETGHVQLTLEQWRGLGVLHSRKLRAVIDSLETTTVGPSHWQIQPTADGKLSSICGWETKVGNAKILYSICRRFNLQMWNLLMQSQRIPRADFIYWKKNPCVNGSAQFKAKGQLYLLVRATHVPAIFSTGQSLCCYGRIPPCASLKRILTIWGNVSLSLSVSGPYTWNALTHWLCH